jgi:uncharacterized sulfatase
MGAPNQLTDTAIPSREDLENMTRVAFADFDASPTKAWLIENRASSDAAPFYERAFGKRPGEELYDLRHDPNQLKNVADEASYLVEKNDLSRRLIKVLTDTRDPRVTGDRKTFDQSPFTDPEQIPARPRPRQ